jgi:hypothetical protein
LQQDGTAGERRQTASTLPSLLRHFIIPWKSMRGGFGARADDKFCPKPPGRAFFKSIMLLLARAPPGYRRVMVGTLKELIEYTCLHYRGQLGLYRITVGTNRYGGQVIRDLFHSPNFPKSSVAH